MFISDDEVVYYGVKMLIAYMLSGSRDRHAFCKYELYAVCKLRIACNHPFRYASGRPPDSAALHPAADRRIRRRDIRSGNYRLYSCIFFNGILEKYKKKSWI